MSNNEIRVNYGIRLAGLRKEADLSIETIAKQLQIAKSIVMNIESGQTHQIPKVFLLSYISAYANLVNLPEEELSDYLKEVDEEQKKQLIIKHYSQIGKPKRYGKHIVTIMFCISLIISGILIFFCMNRQHLIQGYV